MTNFTLSFSNPNKESLTAQPHVDERAWPAFTIPGLQYKELALNLTTGSGLRVNECQFWNDYLPKLTTFSGTFANTKLPINHYINVNSRLIWFST